MLLEAFVNRHRNYWVAPIHFATVLLPLTLILGVLICIVGTPMVIIMAVLDIHPEVFSPKLSMACALAGGGLMLAPLAIGAIHGQIREKQRGIERDGYGQKMMVYLMVLGMALPFPLLYGAKFFYNYPFARYPSYILEVKPSLELEREIERFGLAEIKWHTPYDYSLDRQVIRYDFGEPVDGDWRTFRSKRSIFEEVAGQSDTRVFKLINDGRGIEFIDRNSVMFPIAKIADDGGTICVLPIRLRKIEDDVRKLEYQVEDRKGHFKVMRSDLLSKDAYVDVSTVFTPYRPEKASGVLVGGWSCGVYDYGDAYLFISYNLLLPNIKENIIFYSKELRIELNFSLSQILISIRGF